MKNTFFVFAFLFSTAIFGQVTGNWVIQNKVTYKNTEGVYFDSNDTCVYYMVSIFIPYDNLKNKDSLAIAVLSSYEKGKFYPNTDSVIIVHNIEYEVGVDGQNLVTIYKTPETSRMAMGDNRLDLIPNGGVIQRFTVLFDPKDTR
jgi:hypothetical protein